MTRALTGFLVGAPVWLAIGVYIGLRLVWAEEPAYVEPDEDWATDPYTIGWTVTAGSGKPLTGYLTTLTEGGNPR